MKKCMYLFLVLLFFACSNDNEKIEEEDENPIQNLELPSSETVFKPGDELTIKGQGFTDKSEIWFTPFEEETRSGGVKAEVKTVDAEGITIITPEVYGKQRIVLKQDGKAWNLGNVNFEEENEPPVEKTEVLYAFKGVSVDSITDWLQLVRIDIETGEEEIVIKHMVTKKYTERPVYIPSLHQIVTVYDTDKLLIIDLETEGIRILNLESGSLNYNCPFVDKEGNFYTYKYDYRGNLNSHQIVKIDLSSGLEEVIINDLGLDYYIDYIVYIPSTSDILGVYWNNFLLKANLLTETTSIINTFPEKTDCQGLIIDNEENIYAYKRDWSTSQDLYQILKIDVYNYKEEILVNNLQIESSYFESLVCCPFSNYILGIDWNNSSIKRINTKTGFVKNLTPNVNRIMYEQLVVAIY